MYDFGANAGCILEVLRCLHFPRIHYNKYYKYRDNKERYNEKK